MRKEKRRKWEQKEEKRRGSGEEKKKKKEGRKEGKKSSRRKEGRKEGREAREEKRARRGEERKGKEKQEGGAFCILVFCFHTLHTIQNHTYRTDSISPLQGMHVVTMDPQSPRLYKCPQNKYHAPLL